MDKKEPDSAFLGLVKEIKDYAKRGL